MTNTIENANPKNKAEREMAHLNWLILELKSWETRNPRNPKVDKALQLITYHMKPYEYTLLSRNFLVTIHGSLLYHDPINLDVDLTFTCDHIYDENLLGLIEQKVSSKLCYIEWPESGYNSGRCDPNFSTFSMESVRLQTILEEFKDQPYDDENEVLDLDLSSMLTSGCFYPSQQALFDRHKSSVLSLLSSSPKLRHAVTLVLEDALQIRRERAASRSLP